MVRVILKTCLQKNAFRSHPNYRNQSFIGQISLLFFRPIIALLLVLLALAACSPNPTLSLSTNPTEITLAGGAKPLAIQATVLGSDETVSWQLSEAVGQLDQTEGSVVHYTPPSNVAAKTQVTLIARVGKTAVYAQTVITLEPNPIELTINPPNVGLISGSAPFTFRATTLNAGAIVHWFLSSDLGTIAEQGNGTVTYTPPSGLEKATTVVLNAQLEGSPYTATSTITVNPLVYSLEIASDKKNISFGDKPLNLMAELNHAATGEIRWSISPNVGSLSSETGENVQYIPPNGVSTTTKVTVTASLTGTTASSTTTLFIEPPNSSLLACSSFSVPTLTESITGYSDKISYYPGENLKLKVSLPRQGHFATAIFREGKESQLRWFNPDLVGGPQAVSAAKPYATDLKWGTSLNLEIPVDWSSGLYKARLINLEDRSCFQVIFLVKQPPNAKKSRILVLASDFTWQAYNPWGGASFYTCNGSCDGKSVAPIISTQRPNSQVFIDRSDYEHLSFGFLTILQWLEQHNYSYDVISDTDLDSDARALDGYPVFLLDRHSEYWSGAMYDRLEGFLSQGGNLVNLGGNQIYWRTVAKNGLLETRKDGLSHTLTLSPEPGGKWATLGRPESRVLGVRFTPTGANVEPYGAYRVLAPSHWIMSGTGLQQGQSFGTTCSGWETDKIDVANPPAGSLESIARGDNQDPSRTGQAGGDMVFYHHPGGGGVFSAGSLSFLNQSCRSDPAVQQIIKNILDHFLNA